MEIQLQELIGQIKKDGVEAAESQAASIRAAANADAEKILADAKAQANKLLAEAKEQTDRMVKVSEDAIRQAGRNLLISFRESVARELTAILGDQVTAVYSSDGFTQLLANAIEAWVQNTQAQDVSVVLNSQDADRLNAALLSALKQKAIDGITLKASDNFDGGFRVVVKDGGAYYDYSKEEVTAMLSTYLTPRVTALMKEAEEL